MSTERVTGENAERLTEAESALIRCRDGASAIALLVKHPFESNLEVDRARNAIEWAAEKLAFDIETAVDALDQVKFDRRYGADSLPRDEAQS